jgi:hypothetical protein
MKNNEFENEVGQREGGSRAARANSWDEKRALVSECVRTVVAERMKYERAMGGGRFGEVDYIVAVWRTLIDKRCRSSDEVEELIRYLAIAHIRELTIQELLGQEE